MPLFFHNSFWNKFRLFEKIQNLFHVLRTFFADNINEKKNLIQNIRVGANSVLKAKRRKRALAPSLKDKKEKEKKGSKKNYWRKNLNQEKLIVFLC